MARPSQLGDVCRYGSDYFLVTYVGPRGGCEGPCIHGPRSRRKGRFTKLKSATVLVPPEQWPDEVCAAVAQWRMGVEP